VIGAGLVVEGIQDYTSHNLWPLAIIAMTVVSVPQFIVAMIASSIAKKMAPPDEPES